MPEAPLPGGSDPPGRDIPLVLLMVYSGHIFANEARCARFMPEPFDLTRLSSEDINPPKQPLQAGERRRGREEYPGPGGIYP